MTGKTGQLKTINDTMRRECDVLARDGTGRRDA